MVDPTLTDVLTPTTSSLVYTNSLSGNTKDPLVSTPATVGVNVT